MSFPGNMPTIEVDKNILRSEIMQDRIDKQFEPAYKTRIINKLNKHFAEKKSGICIRQPQPSIIACCFYIEHAWTDEQSKQFLNDGTLPRDLTNIDWKAKVLKIWIFDATGNSPDSDHIVIKLDGSKPNWESTKPALCVFELGLEDHMVVIPSQYLELVPMAEDDKVRFVFKEGASEYLQKNLDSEEVAKPL